MAGGSLMISCRFIICWNMLQVSDRSRYKNDVPVLKVLYNKVVAEIGKRECLEKKSFEEMATRLKQAIDRNSGFCVNLGDIH